MITKGQTLTARSICDYNCVFTCKVIDRKNSFATVKIDGQIKRTKIYTDSDGSEYVYALGRYSMAPTFKNR